MNAKTFAKVLSQLTQLLEALSEEEILAAVDGSAQLALTIELKGRSRKIGGTTKKAPKAPDIAPAAVVEKLGLAHSRQEALTLLEDSKFTSPKLKEVLALLNLPTTGAKQVLTNRIIDQVGSRADALAIRGF